MFSELISRVSNEFVFERAKPFSGNELASCIRNELADEAKRLTLFRNEKYLIKGSAGAGNWASVPWLGFFDPIITETAQEGFYVVFLFNVQSSEVFLSLNQGTTAVYREFGQKAGLEVLRRRAKDIHDRIQDVSSDFSRDAISLGSPESLPLGYEAGHALGQRFLAGQCNDSDLNSALQAMLDVYQELIRRGGLLPTDVMMEEARTNNIEECRKYILSRRIERAKMVRKAVFATKPPICEACGLRPEQDYSFSGKAHRSPLEVHHLRPLYSLMEGERTLYRVPDDFAVLCPTCHRVAHSNHDPSDIEMLRSMIRFKHMREVI